MGLWEWEGGVTRWSEISFHYCMRLKHSTAISVVLARSLRPGLFKMCKARRQACRLQVLETPGAFGVRQAQ